MRPASIAALGLLTITAGCTVPRPASPGGTVANRCNLTSTPLMIDMPADAVAGGETEAAAPQSRLAQILAAAAQTRSLESNQPGPRAAIPTHLILSGGGQDGAFGTGFLAGLHDRAQDPSNGGLYKDDGLYDVVTGVSTGALQAPMALLGREASPADRILSPATGDYPARPEGFRPRNIDDLVSAYTITREQTLYRNRGLLELVRKAHLGDLGPLRTRIYALITDQTLHDLAKLDSETRGLFVALLNWDTGNAEQIDMLALARDYAGGDQHARDCFVDVLLAASSEPIGTPPVMIDGHFYVDAGLRFGVFAHDLVDAAAAVAKPHIDAAEAALRNAHDARVAAEARLAAAQELPARAGTSAERLAATQAEAEKKEALAHANLAEQGAGANLEAVRNTVYVRTDVIRNGDITLRPEAPARYSALTIMGRGRSILVNQVYSFSIRDILSRAGDGHQVRFAFITREEMDSPRPKDGAEFDPDHMARMLKRGHERGIRGQWNTILPATRPN